MTEKEKDKTGLLVNHRMSMNPWSDVARIKKKNSQKVQRCIWQTMFSKEEEKGSIIPLGSRLRRLCLVLAISTGKSWTQAIAETGFLGNWENVPGGE